MLWLKQHCGCSRPSLETSKAIWQRWWILARLDEPGLVVHPLCQTGLPQVPGPACKEGHWYIYGRKNLYINIYGCFQTLYVEKNGYMTDNGFGLAAGFRPALLGLSAGP